MALEVLLEAFKASPDPIADILSLKDAGYNYDDRPSNYVRVS